MIIKVFTTGPVETHSILLACDQTKHAAVIDVPPESSSLLLKEIKEKNLNPQMILLTHSHWDHLADAALLKRNLGVPIFVHEEDAQNLEKPGSDGLPLFFPIEGIKPDGFLQDGQTIQLGNLEIHVISTPGHTPGCVCFWLIKEKVLISGDTLFKGTIGNLSFPTGRPRLMKESLKKLSKLPPETRVIPGHGPETTILDEMATFRQMLNSRTDLFL